MSLFFGYEEEKTAGISNHDDQELKIWTLGQIGSSEGHSQTYARDQASKALPLAWRSDDRGYRYE